MVLEFTYKTRAFKGRRSPEMSQTVSFNAGRKRIRGLASDTYLRTHSSVQLMTVHRETNYG